METQDALFEEKAPVPDDGPLAYAAGALGSDPRGAPSPEPIGPSEAEHLAVYLRRLDATVGRFCARLGLSRQEMRDGAPPRPGREVSVEERHAAGSFLEGLERIEELVALEGAAAVADYAEGEVLLALAHVGREIEAEELRLWLTPTAQEALRLEDCRAALERLAERDAIRARRRLVPGGDWSTSFLGERVLHFNGCGELRRFYQAPYRAPSLRR